MNLQRKKLGYIITLLTMVLIIFGIYLTLEYKICDTEEQNNDKENLSVDPCVCSDLVARQQDNGSWNNDLETTAIASNALAQSVNLMDEHKGNIDCGNGNTSIEFIRSTNQQSVENAQQWTDKNYDNELPLNSQITINYNIVVLSQSNNFNGDNVTYLAEQTNGMILSTQSEDGSWNNDVQQTSLSIYVLKKNQDLNKDEIIAGENWLISRQDDGSWGNVQNDIFALLALHNSSYDVGELIEGVKIYQMENGSFGDIETTAWALIALSLYDDQDACEAAKAASGWLKQQDNVSDRDLALISLAEMEYISAEINRIDDMEGVWEGKGPPTILIFIMGLIGSTILVLSILFIRIRECEVLEGVREDIYDYVKAHPGVNQNEIKRSLNLSSSSIRHHLRILERFEHILPYNDGKYIRYYIDKNGYGIYTNGNGYKEIISVLRKNTAANIVKYLIENPKITQKHLANALNLHPSTIHWHAKLLLASKIISVERNGKSVQYQINEPLDLNKLLAIAI